MYPDKIFNMTQKLINQNKSRDPYIIAESLGIMVRESMDFVKLCGLYTIIKRKRIIILNGNMAEEKKRIVLAHEIGHDLIHRDLAKNTALQEVMIFDMTARPEYEANMFAADLLLDDYEIINLATQYDYNLDQIACNLGADVNLLKVKIDNMIYRGYEINNIDGYKNFL